MYRASGVGAAMGTRCCKCLQSFLNEVGSGYLSQRSHFSTVECAIHSPVHEMAVCFGDGLTRIGQLISIAGDRTLGMC
jgi:hypothetical protein